MPLPLQMKKLHTFEDEDFLVFWRYIYYQKLASGSSSYVLLNDAPLTVVHADAVVAIKFPMPRVKHKAKGHNIAYHLNLGVHSRILANIAN